MKHAMNIGVLLCFAAVAAGGCAKGDAAEEKALAAQQQQGVSRQQAPPRVTTITVPAGTSFVATLQTPLATDTNNSGDSFTAITTESVVVDGKTVIPAGSQVRGSLRDVQASGRIKGRARMTLGYDQVIDASGTSQSISTQPLTLQADSGTRGDVEKIAAGTVLGAIIGSVNNGKKGAAIGGAIGAGAGTIVVLATKGDDVELNSGQRLSVIMTSPTSMKLASRN